MPGLSISAPRPEATALQLAFVHQTEGVFIIDVPTLSGRTQLDAIAIAGIAELLQDHGLVQVLHDVPATFHIGTRHASCIGNAIHDRGFAVLCQAILQRSAGRAEPMPVVGPDVDADVVNLGEGMNLMEQFGVFFAAFEAFASCGDEVVRVEALDELSLCFDPLGEAGFRHGIAGEGTRFVGEFPGHDGRRLAVGLAGDGVGA